jgi:hypothetical protein
MQRSLQWRVRKMHAISEASGRVAARLLGNFGTYGTVRMGDVIRIFGST